MDPLIKHAKWVTKIGHELTFIPNEKFSDEVIANVHYGYSATYEKTLMKREISFTERIRKKRIKHDDCGLDCAVIEISSEPLENWDTFVRWNKSVRSIAKDLNLTHKFDWLSGGMGHHHIDMQTPDVTNNLFRIVADRPYLTWMFVDPDDNENCRTIASWFIALKTCSYTFFTARTVMDSDVLPGGKLPCLTVRGRTIEWRAFDSAEDMTMQIEHTAFLQALVGYAQRTTTSIPVRAPMFKNVKQARDLLKKYQDPNLCAKEFLKFIKLIGLPPDRYERYIEMNLIPRLERGNGV